MRNIKLARIHKMKEEKKKRAELGKKRVAEYVEARIKGKVSPSQILWDIKDDFFRFAEKKGGVIKKVAAVIKERADKYAEDGDLAEDQEQADAAPQNETAQASEAEDDLDIADIDLEPTKEEEKTEVSQEVLDSIFGKDDDDIENEEDEAESEADQAKEEELAQEKAEAEKAEKEAEEREQQVRAAAEAAAQAKLANEREEQLAREKADKEKAEAEAVAAAQVQRKKEEEERIRIEKEE